MQTADIEPIASHAADFRPRRFLNNGHLQTIAGNYFSRVNQLPLPEAQLVEVSPATANQIASQVLCQCHWQQEEVRAVRPTAIVVQGLEGASESQYVVGNANRLWREGSNVVLMNMRNCGGTEALSPTLYPSGLSNDVLAVMNFFVERYGLQSMSLIGYSMGGNLVLKLAGELGTAAPNVLRSVIGVSPAADLQPSADALHLPQNRLYEWKFLRNLLRRFRRKAMLFPRAYDRNRATGIRSLREFDDRITALYSGFSSPDDYYYRAAAARVLDRIAVPSLVLHALDDPFVRLSAETLDKIAANPNVTMRESRHGGHCAFLAQPAAPFWSAASWANHTLSPLL